MIDSLIRITVLASGRRLDVAVPGGVPVAELIPELSAQVGLLEAGSAHHALRLVTHDGRPLRGEGGLTTQGVVDGGLLALAPAADVRPPRVDDLAEALSDAARDLPQWDAAATRGTFLIAVLPVVVVGVILVSAGLLDQAMAADQTVVLMSAMTALVLCGRELCWAAVGAWTSGLDVEPIGSAGIDTDRVRRHAASAHDLLAAVSASIGLLVVIVAPVAVSAGAFGALLSVAACTLVMLRARSLSRREVAIALGTGLGGLSCAAAAAVWRYPDGRFWLSVGCVVGGVVVLGMAALSRRLSARLGRLGDLAESACVVALLPALALASGVVDAVLT